MKVRLFLSLWIFGLLPAKALTLAWDPSPASNITGYKVYYGTGKGSYSQTVSAASTTASISGLAPGVTYFFAVTALDSFGLESDYSAEISYTVPEGGGAARPRLTAVRADPGHVLITWPTNFPGYTLTWSTDLRTWQKFSQAPVLSGTNWTFIDSTDCCPNWWFYRLAR